MDNRHDFGSPLTGAGKGRSKRWLFAVALVLILLAATDPSKDDFAKWLVRQSVEEYDLQNIEKATDLVGLTNGIELFGSPLVKLAASETDMIVFSYFEVGDTVKVVGFLKRFFFRL